MAVWCQRHRFFFIRVPNSVHSESVRDQHMIDASLTKLKLPWTCLERIPFISSVYRATEDKIDAPEISVT